MIIGSHVAFTKDTQLLGTVEKAINYGANTFMFYTGAPQNTIRMKIDKTLSTKAHDMMKENDIDINNVVVHAPYIINLANDTIIDNYNFAKQFLKEEIKRCEELGITKMVLHPGSKVKLDYNKAILNLTSALNEVLKNSSVTILLETMAGKGGELGRTTQELKDIIDKIENKDKIGICLDTCHLNDAGYDMKDFSKYLKELEDNNLLDKVGCIHINDSKNVIASHKDRHENIGYGTIGFDDMIKIIYNEKLKDIPKILETPYINDLPPYKDEIKMIKDKKWYNIK